MINYIRKLWTRLTVKSREEQKFDTAYFLVNRHYLASISPRDLDSTFEGMTEADKREYLAQASLIWTNPVFTREVKSIIGSQVLFVAAECNNWEQSLIGRGTINGVGLVEERFKRLHSMYLDNVSNSRSNNEEDFRESVIPRV